MNKSIAGRACLCLAGVFFLFGSGCSSKSSYNKKNPPTEVPVDVKKQTQKSPVAKDDIKTKKVVKTKVIKTKELELLKPSSIKKLEEKGFSKKWIKSLAQKGEPEIYSGKQLDYIGMPIGGMFAGQVYLGGDGDLWYWDIQNRRVINPGSSGDKFYRQPMWPSHHKGVEQGFYIEVEVNNKRERRRLSKLDFSNITFRGTYPISTVTYSDEDFPVEIVLTAYSPFCPTNTDESSLPVTILEYQVNNRTTAPVKVQLGGWLQNIASRSVKDASMGMLQNRVLKYDGYTQLVCDTAKVATRDNARQDIIFDDFERGDYTNWTAEGKAFGEMPFVRTDFARYHNVTGHQGTVLVNSHNTRETGENSQNADALTGTLTSKAFTIERDYITFKIGGGAHKGQTEIQLVVDGKVIASQQGNNSNKMVTKLMSTKEHAGRLAQLRVVDSATGGWGHIGIDNIVFTDDIEGVESLRDMPDYGSMALTLIGAEKVRANVSFQLTEPAQMFIQEKEKAQVPLGEKLIGAVATEYELAPKQKSSSSFAISWHFANIHTGEHALRAIRDMANQRNYYSKRFKNAALVGEYVTKNYKKLSETTKSWVETWYDSSLPDWFLTRTFINTSTLASTSWHRFHNPNNPQLDGRPYCWEGVYLGDGSCTHVLHYEQAMGRVFPNVTRDMREKVDFGIAFDERLGYIRYRAEYGYGQHHGIPHAIDGHCGTILRMYREYTMDKDSEFLKRNWPRVKKSIQCAINQDKEKTGVADGILEGPQYNTLDRVWYGQIPWISGLYNAVLLAGSNMAEDMDDDEFAKECAEIATLGKQNLSKLFNGEYFIQRVNPAHPESPNTNIGCHIDQLLGESTAMQIGLPHVFAKAEAKSATESIFKYNFMKDIGTYQKNARVKPHRFYSLPGEAGTTVCTFPKDGAESTSSDRHGLIGGYFSECMTGMEYPIAALMINSDMVGEGLALIKAIHDRYAPKKRNPFNDIEYGNHYTRAMSGYAPFISISGFDYHGPKGRIAFAPKLSPASFRSAFITAEGWGSFEQTIDGGTQKETLLLKYGALTLKELRFKGSANSVKVTLNGKVERATLKNTDGNLVVTLSQGLVLRAHDELILEFAIKR